MHSEQMVINIYILSQSNFFKKLECTHISNGDLEQSFKWGDEKNNHFSDTALSTHGRKKYSKVCTTAEAWNLWLESSF